MTTLENCVELACEADSTYSPETHVLLLDLVLGPEIRQKFLRSTQLY